MVCQGLGVPLRAVAVLETLIGVCNLICGSCVWVWFILEVLGVGSLILCFCWLGVLSVMVLGIW